jgi:hypothetical protein
MRLPILTVLNRKEPDDDLLRRVLVERRPPLTWRGIAGCAVASAAGLLLGLAREGWLWEAAALGLFIVDGLQVLRGVLRMRGCGSAVRMNPS